MTDAEEARLEAVSMGLIIGLHTAYAVYRWVREERRAAAWHGGVAIVEGMAVWRHEEAT